MKYDLNISRLIDGLLPAFLRTTKQKAWLAALTGPLKSLSQDFSNLRSTAGNTLIWNGQTISLEHVISQKLGPGVTISNTGKVERPFYVYGANNGRNQQVVIAGDPRNPNVYEAGEIDADAVDFEVKLPLNSPIDLYQLTILVNQYKLYSKRFKIVEHEEE